MESESSSGFVSVLGDHLSGGSLASGRIWARSARRLKWMSVLVAAVLIVLGLVTSPVIQRPGLPAVAGSFPVESISTRLLPGGYGGADLAWAKLRQAELAGADLQRAALVGADLSGANLRQAHLDGASLLGANMGGAHLQGATLSRADLRWVYLSDADLRQADLRWANLKAANLEYANLEGATLRHASLDRAHLRGATLPDGSTWTPSSDLGRFTDPAHPDFWPAEDRDLDVVPLRHLPELSAIR
jgi:hypothetical protein